MSRNLHESAAALLAHPSAGWPRRHALILSCVWGLLLVGATATLRPDRAHGQPSSDSTPAIDHNFPRVPREVAEGMSRMRAACEDRQFATAATCLSEVVERVRDEDYFRARADSREAFGFRAELGRFVAACDPELIRQFELLQGRESREALEQALHRHDERLLEACFRQWWPTEAGQQAALLLARLDLDRDRPWPAIRRLEPLTRLPTARQLEPELSVLLAWSLLAAEQPALAREALERLRREQEAVVIQIAGDDVRLFGQSQPAWELLPATARRSSAKPLDWLSYRGGAAHAPRCPPPPQGAAAVWSRNLDERNWEQDAWVAQCREQDIALAPVLGPLALGHQIVARSTQGLRGALVADGQTMWEFPPESVPPTEPWPADLDPAEQAARRRTRELQGVWQDGCFGRISSDGERVFFVDQLEPIETPSRPALARAIGAGLPSASPPPPSSNVLVALDATRSGAVAWMVGGPTGHGEPRLAGAYFLGPPLSVDAALYAVAESTGRVQLVALDGETGSLRWALAVADLDAQSIVESPARRFPGVSPAYARGTLVCDTSAGGVVAVDVASHTFRWGYQYRQTPHARNASVDPFRGKPRWFDADVLIVGTHVLAAADAEEIQCFDLESGALRWKHPRRDTMFLASAGEEAVLLVGQHRFTALRLPDGSHAWPHAEYVAIPGGGQPCGRGLFDGSLYYLPTTDPELLKIDVASGLVIERCATASPLGNLIMHGETLIAQNESALTAFVAGGATEPARVPLPRARLDTSQLGPGALMALLANADYFTREAGTQELLARGTAAIPAWAEGAASEDPEVAYRCTTALVGFLEDHDPKIATRARIELQALSSRAATPFAADAYARESQRRAGQALIVLPQLGASVSPDGKSVTLSPGWRGGGDGLAHLAWLPQLTSLELRHPSVDDTGLAILAPMPNVTSLNLNRSSVTSDGLRHLAAWPKLQTLLLQGTRIDDSGIEHLKRLSRLRGLNLLRTGCTSQGVERLRQALPSANILH